MKKFAILILFASVLMLAACAPKPTPPFNAEMDFKRANEKLEDKFYDDARQTFERIIRMDTEYVYAPLAQLRLADSYKMDDEPELALDEYRKFLDIYPRHKFAAYAQYQIGMIHFKMIKGPDRGYGPALNALAAFRALNERYPRHPYREDTAVKIAQSKETIAEHELQVGSFYMKNGAYHGATERFEGILNDFPEYAENPQFLGRLAVAYEGLERKEDSERMLGELKKLFPDSKYLKKAKKDIRKIQEKRAEEIAEKEKMLAEDAEEKKSPESEPVSQPEPSTYK